MRKALGWRAQAHWVTGNEKSGESYKTETAGWKQQDRGSEKLRRIQRKLTRG